MRLVIAAAWVLCCFAASIDDQFNGRWDITVNGDRSRAWWLEVSGAGTNNTKAKFVGTPDGLVEDIPKISISDGELRFGLERHYTRDVRGLQKGLYYARLEAGKLKGTFEIEGDPASYLEWVGVRAPVLPGKDDATWKRGDPISLFNARDLSGWQPQVPNRPLGWSVRDGLLVNSFGANNLVSEKKFFNFALHVEYRIAPHTSSGIGLRGRYEVQIADDFDKPASVRGSGAIYGRIAPSMNASDAPGEWQTLDTRLIGREVTVALNGMRVIDKQVIEGISGIAIDANEADPGPILLQGDHGIITFRKLVVYPLTRQPPPPQQSR